MYFNPLCSSSDSGSSSQEKHYSVPRNLPALEPHSDLSFKDASGHPSGKHNIRSDTDGHFLFWHNALGECIVPGCPVTMASVCKCLPVQWASSIHTCVGHRERMPISPLDLQPVPELNPQLESAAELPTGVCFVGTVYVWLMCCGMAHCC